MAHLAPLPACHQRPVADHWRELEALPKTPLLVEGTLLTPYVPATPDGALHLDGLLSWAALQAYPAALHWPRGEACVMPLPLALLEVVDGPGGARLPVWAASDLLPQGDVLRDREYWHKRYPTDRASWGRKLSADTGTGRYKEYRIPLGTVRAERLRGVCLGHQESVAALLAHITHVGKKPAQGMGRVTGWTVTPLDESEAATLEMIRASRPLPGRGGGFGGFTPPYSHRPWHSGLEAR